MFCTLDESAKILTEPVREVDLKEGILYFSTLIKPPAAVYFRTYPKFSVIGIPLNGGIPFVVEPGDDRRFVPVPETTKILLKNKWS